MKEKIEIDPVNNINLWIDEAGLYIQNIWENGGKDEIEEILIIHEKLPVFLKALKNVLNNNKYKIKGA